MNKILTILLFFISALVVNAEEQVWTLTTDGGQQIAVADVDYLIASDNSKEFSVVLKGGSTIDAVKEVSFMLTSGVEVVEIEDALKMYPNPVESVFNLSGCKTGMNINILSLDGKLLKCIVVESDNTTVDVTDLAPGYYLLSTDCSTIKFIKK